MDRAWCFATRNNRDSRSGNQRKRPERPASLSTSCRRRLNGLTRVSNYGWLRQRRRRNDGSTHTVGEKSEPPPPPKKQRHAVGEGVLRGSVGMVCTEVKSDLSTLTSNCRSRSAVEFACIRRDCVIVTAFNLRSPSREFDPRPFRPCFLAWRPWTSCPHPGVSAAKCSNAVLVKERREKNQGNQGTSSWLRNKDWYWSSNSVLMKRQDKFIARYKYAANPFCVFFVLTLRLIWHLVKVTVMSLFSLFVCLFCFSASLSMSISTMHLLCCVYTFII